MYQAKEMRRTSAHRQSASHGATVQHPMLWLPAAEAITGVALIVAIGLAMPGSGWGLLNINPHPLWFIAAAIAARYGGQAGYFSGALSGLTYTALFMARSGGSLSQLDVAMLLQPLLMLITGAALGELADARENRLTNLEERSRALEGALNHLWGRYRAASAVNDALKKEIAFGANNEDSAAMGAKLKMTATPAFQRASRGYRGQAYPLK